MATDKTKGILIVSIVVLSVLCIVLAVRGSVIIASGKSNIEKVVQLERELTNIKADLETKEDKETSLEKQLKETFAKLKESSTANDILKGQLAEEIRMRKGLEVRLREANENRELLERKLEATGTP